MLECKRTSRGGCFQLNWLRADGSSQAFKANVEIQVETLVYLMAYMSGMTSYMHIRLGKRLKLGQSRRSMPSHNHLEPVNKVMSKGQHMSQLTVDIQPKLGNLLDP